MSHGPQRFGLSIRMMMAMVCVAGLTLLAGAVPLAAAAPASAMDTAAQQVLEAAGVKGGLVVHLGAGDGRLTAAIAQAGPYLVHGLEADPANVAKARETIRQAGLYGQASVERWDAKRLPYVDNLVNLLVAEDLGGVAMDEVTRVLAPNGVAYVRGTGPLTATGPTDGAWTRTVKPRPDTTDDWTHFLYDASNNAVSNDRDVAPPRHMQWVGSPMWARSHDHLATISAGVVAGGRLFYIVDEGPTAAVVLPARWFLVARDASSGVILWKRPIPTWEWHLRGFRSGPSDIARRLVAVGDEVYVTLGYNEPVSALDGATGRTLRTYKGTEGAREILWHDGTLLVVTGGAVPGWRTDADPDAKPRPGFGLVRPQRPDYPIEMPPKGIVALDAKTGRPLWQKADADTRDLMPTTLCAKGDRVFFQNAQAVFCLDAARGSPRWKADRPVSTNRPTWSAPTLVAYGDVILSADRSASDAILPGAKSTNGVVWVVTSNGGQSPPGDLVAFSADTGHRLWSSPCQECYNAPTDVLVADGLVWTGNLVKATQPGITQGLDPRTGEVKRTRPTDAEQFSVGMNHHRCHRNRATCRYLVLGRAGVELVDVATGEADASHWTRGGCQYGVIPANGLIYTPSHSCACYINGKLNGFNALAPASPSREVSTDITEAGRLEKGPAYGSAAAKPASAISNLESQISEAAWPTYRHDAARTGATKVAVPTQLKRTWQTDLGGRLSSPVTADGKVFVAEIDARTVHALDAATGRSVWSFTAGGRVDSPPTVFEGRVLFGSADGYVTCLRAADGILAWRFRAAPEDRRVVAYEQVESVWPVPGSVLVDDGVAWVAAGRSSFLDGGIFVYRLDPASGKMLSVTQVSTRDPETGKEPKNIARGTGMQAGALPDVLSSDGTSVFMRHTRFDRTGKEQPADVPHLFSSVGFLDDAWWHRTYWFIGTQMGNGYGGWPSPGTRVPSGRLLVVSGPQVYGFGRNLYINHGAHVGIDGTTVYHYKANTKAETLYRLFAATYEAGGGAAAKGGKAKPPETQVRWNEQIPVLARAMVLAGETLFLAGPPDLFATDDPTAALEGRKGGALLAIAPADGKASARYDLDAPPVFDGLIAIGGRLLMATTDGKVICFEGK